jgi:hypothetical protein
LHQTRESKKFTNCELFNAFQEIGGLSSPFCGGRRTLLSWIFRIAMERPGLALRLPIESERLFELVERFTAEDG